MSRSYLILLSNCYFELHYEIILEEGGNCYFELHYEIILEDAIAFFIGYWVKNRVPKQSHRTIQRKWSQVLDTGRYDNIPC